MMKIKNALILVAIYFISCTHQNKNIEKTEIVSDQTLRDTLLNQITLLEKNIDTTKSINYIYGSTMVKTYLDFITHFPTDAYSPDYLFKAAEISMNLNQNEKAIELFLKLHDFYPNCVKAPFALYLAGFVSENKLYDTAMARKYYNQLIAQYPDKPIANDAKNTLKNLGKTDEQIVRDFEKAQMNVSNKKEKK